MNSNAEFESLARELRALRAGARGDEESRSRETMLVMRLVRGLSRQRWQKFCRQFPLSQWCALPVPDAMASARVADLRPDMQAPLSPDMPPTALAGALNTELFTSQLKRELLRLNRNDGDLSLLGVGLLPPEDAASAAPEADRAGNEALEQLAASLRHCLEACDSMGVLRQKRLVALLPGMGQLKVRRLAEQVQQSFRRRLSANGKTLTDCAVGLVSVSRGGDCDTSRLLVKTHAALENAQAQATGHIHQEISSPLDERTTLVHSHEKRFLFFGGDQP